MANSYHHAVSSARKWGGKPEDYQHIHDWFDETKALLADFRHRALRHHSEGIFLCEQVFGPTIKLSVCRHCGKPADEHDGFQCVGEQHVGFYFSPKLIPTRWIGEQHVKEDFAGRIPTAVDWLKAIQPQAWMSPRTHLERDLEEGALTRAEEATI